MAQAGRLQQRRILITGAASGIGRRTALLFAAEGAALTLLDRSVEGLGEIARETGGSPAGLTCPMRGRCHTTSSAARPQWVALTASLTPPALSFAVRCSMSGLPTGGV